MTDLTAAYTATFGLATGVAWLWTGLAVLIAACAVVYVITWAAVRALAWIERRDDQHAADDQSGLITFDAPTLAEAFGWLDEKTETWLFPSDEFIEGDFYLWACELREGSA